MSETNEEAVRAAREAYEEAKKNYDNTEGMLEVDNMDDMLAGMQLTQESWDILQARKEGLDRIIAETKEKKPEVYQSPVYEEGASELEQMHPKDGPFLRRVYSAAFPKQLELANGNEEKAKERSKDIALQMYKTHNDAAEAQKPEADPGWTGNYK